MCRRTGRPRDLMGGQARRCCVQGGFDAGSASRGVGRPARRAVFCADITVTTASPSTAAPQPRPGDALAKRGDVAAKRSSSSRARPIGIRPSRRWSRRSRTSTARCRSGPESRRPADDKIHGNRRYRIRVLSGRRAEEPKGSLGEGLAVGKSPEGRALKFIHRGSYDAIDSTYRGDHQLPRREAPRGARPVRRILPDRSADNARGQSPHRGLCAGEVTTLLRCHPGASRSGASGIAQVQATAFASISGITGLQQPEFIGFDFSLDAHLRQRAPAHRTARR